MTCFYLVLAAMAPVVVLMWYIYRKDSVQPEPTSWLIRAFLYGVISSFVAIQLTSGLQLLTGWVFDLNQPMSVLRAFFNAFVWAAVPEEAAKLLMLWFVLRSNPYFDERMDGIVYAVCVGLGFAAVENVMYLYSGLADGSWMSIGISRALFAVPGHFLFAVMMGYYYSLYHFRIRRNFVTRCMVLLAPVLAHGVYDGILFSMRGNSALSAVGMILFLLYFRHLHKIGKKRIEKLRTRLIVTNTKNSDN